MSPERSRLRARNSGYGQSSSTGRQILRGGGVLCRALGLSSLGLLWAVSGWASPVPAALFSDHAVLQRGTPVPVWGTATPGEAIELTYRGFRVETEADPEGKWRVELPAMTAGPGALFEIKGNGAFQARDVAVGDVWMCSGQSNMAFTVDQADGADGFRAAADQAWIREMKVPRLAARETPGSPKLRWTPCSPKTVGKFSAVAYQFVRQLYPEGTVPVGIINASYGGTQIAPWMSPEALSASETGRKELQRWKELAQAYPGRQAKYEVDLAAWERRKKAAEKEGAEFREKPPSKIPGRPGHYTQPSSLYFGMLSPLIEFPVSGFVWYQGESNILRPGEYEELLTSFIEDIRGKWQSPELPFFVVQLPLYDERKLQGHPWAQIREAQAKVAEDLPKVSLAVIVDLGEPRDKHPTNKTEVGRRLALLAKGEVFHSGEAAIAPKVKALTKSGDTVEIEFETQGDGLVLRGEAGSKRAFELAGSDGIYHVAEPTLRGTSVALRAPGVSDPQMVRYLQYDAPQAVLFSANGVPARPFILEGGETHQKSEEPSRK